MKKPVIIVATANYSDDESSADLRKLGAEIDSIRNAFFDAEQEGLCEIAPYFDATVEKIEEAFHQYKDAVIGFHYAGHANGFQLMLQQAADAGEFAAFLGKQTQLKFVFLNGCSTRGQVDDLHAEGVPVVMATSTAINDDVAQQFAEQFYRRLAEGASIQAAFNSYQDIVSIKQIPKKDLYRGFQAPSAFDDRFPWELYIKPGAGEIAEWDLPTAAQNPLFGLPPIPPLYDLPARPFRYLHWYGRREAEVFFGRGSEIRKLWQNITDPHANSLVLLYGQSGVGKSSLLEAGLLPRLENQYDVLYLRRHPERGLWGTLSEQFASPQSSPHPRLTASDQRPEAPILGATLSGQHFSGAEILHLWKQREISQGKPLIMILDQAEEAITRPGNTGELADFMEKIRVIFPDQRTTRPQGKLILSFRKEYLAEIQQHIRQRQIPYIGIGLERLGRQGIIEVVNGLVSTERLREQYKAQIDLGLPEAIAELLSNDPASAVAPVLQIMMSRLWDNATPTPDAPPRFTLAQFQDYRKKGWELGNFLNERIEEIQRFQPDIVKNGLLLDLLYFHTTGFSTTQTRSWKEIAARYPAEQHPAIEKLLLNLCDAWLLMELPQNTPEEGRVWSLAHDTLGPVIRQRFNQSTAPGQLASRVWNGIQLDHLPDDDPEAWAKNWLNEEQLQLVETGRNGMRQLSDREERLINESRQAIVSRKKFKKRVRIALALLGILFVAALIAALIWQKRLTTTTRATALRYEAQVMERHDPTKAIKLLEESLRLYPVDATRDIWYQLRRDHLFYETVATHSEGRVTAAAIAPGALEYAISIADSASAAVWVYRYATATHQIIASMQTGTDMECLRYSADGNRLLGAGGDRQLHCWDIKGQDWPGAHIPQDIIRYAALNAQANQAAFIAQNDLQKIIIQQLTDSTHTTVDVYDELSALAFLPEKGNIAAGFLNGQIAVIDPETQESTPIVQHRKPVTALSVSPHGKYLAIAWADTTGLICPLVQGIPDITRSVFMANMEAPARCLVFSPDEKMLLTGSDRGGMLFSAEEGWLLYTLHAEQLSVLDGAFQANSGAIFTLDTEGRLLKWPLPYPATYAIAPAEQAQIIGNQAVLILSGLPRWVSLPFLTPVTSTNASSLTGTALTGLADGRVLIATDQNALILYRQETGETDTLGQLADVAPIVRIHLVHGEAPALLEDQTGQYLWWQVNERRETGRFTPEKGVGAGIAFSPDGKWLFTLGQDGWCMVYPTGATQPADSVQITARPSAYRTQAICAKDAQTIFMALDRHISVWNRTSRQVQQFRPTETPITQLWISPGKVLFSGDEKGIIYRWNTNDQRPDRAWRAPHPTPVQSIETSDRYLLATYLLPDGHSTARLWGLE